MAAAAVAPGVEAEVAQTTVPFQPGATPSEGSRVCPCGCGTVLGAVRGKPALVCRSFWFGLPHEVRRRVMIGDAAAGRMVLRMALEHSRSANPTKGESAQREVAHPGESEALSANTGLLHAPITPAAGEELSPSAPVPVASEASLPSGAADVNTRTVEVDRQAGLPVVQIEDEIQPDPDAPLPAFRPRNVTQRAAAADVAPFCEGLRAEIYEFIRSRGEAGATNEEISDATEIKLQTVCGRVNELQGDERRGFPVMVVCGGYRKTKSGSRAKVWVPV